MNPCPLPDEDRPFFARHAWLAILMIAGGLALLFVSLYSVLTHQLLYGLDTALEPLLKANFNHMPGWLKSAWLFFGNASSILPTPVSLVLCYIFLRKKCDDRFDVVAGSFGIGMMYFFLLALGINRQRPSLPGLLSSLPFPSFPSGHMIQSIDLLAPILYLFLPKVRSRGWRIALLLLGIFYILLVAVGRLITDAHYLTDVLAGIGIGLFWSTTVLVIYERYHLAHPLPERQRVETNPNAG